MDIHKLMRQAEEIKRKMEEAQKDLANSLFEGSAGGGMVNITVTGVGVVKKVTIDASLMNKDEKDILEDLIVAAFNNAKKAADEASSGSIKSVTGGFSLPPGFKL